MNAFTLDNPVFVAYIITAGLAILKMIGHSFFTVYRMIKSNEGLLNPEDARKTLFNPTPSAAQFEPNEYVERARRIHRTEGENTPIFLVAGLLFGAASPPLAFGIVLMFGYIMARVAHSYAYLTMRDNEIRAAFFTIGAIITVIMVLYALIAAFSRIWTPAPLFQ